MKFNELLQKSKKELSESLISLKKEYMNLRIAMKSPTEDFNPSVVKKCKRSIARVKTRLRQLRDKE